MSEDTSRFEEVEQIELADRKRRDSISRAMCSVVTVIIFIFMVIDAARGQIVIAVVLACFVALNIMAMSIYSRIQSLNVFSFYLTLSCGALCLYLVASGGTEDSGILWLPAFPILMYSILKVHSAVVVNCGMAIIICYIFFVPHNPFLLAEYTFFTKFIGLASFTLSSAFTFFQASARERATTVVASLNHELSYIASTDELTQLSNRRDMSLRLEFECKRSKRTSEEFSIILCDIDYFKKINDSFGHNVGDQALQAFSGLLISRFRDTDSAGRWGGEEFLAILPNTTLEEAILLANKVRKSICQASLFPNMPNRLVTMSAGVASSKESLDPIDIVSIADKRLYEAKDAGRNRVRPQSQSEEMISGHQGNPEYSALK